MGNGKFFLRGSVRHTVNFICEMDCIIVQCTDNTCLKHRRILMGCSLGPHVLPYIECTTIGARVGNKVYETLLKCCSYNCASYL